MINPSIDPVPCGSGMQVIYTWDHFQQDKNPMMNFLGIHQPVNIVGIFSGGLVAAQFASSYAKATFSLVGFDENKEPFWILDDRTDGMTVFVDDVIKTGKSITTFLDMVPGSLGYILIATTEDVDSRVTYSRLQNAEGCNFAPAWRF